MAGRRSKRLRANLTIRVAFLGPNATFTGDLVDISKSGLLVRTSENLEAGTIGKIGIPMGQETLRIVVAVRRQVTPIGIALEFLQMGQHDRELLHRLLLRVQTSV